MGRCGGVNESQNFAMFFPHLAGLVIERFAMEGTVVQAHARMKGLRATCPGCGAVMDQDPASRRLFDAGRHAEVIARYEQHAADLGRTDHLLRVQAAFLQPCVPVPAPAGAPRLKRYRNE